jgi:hypothetical protein
MQFLMAYFLLRRINSLDFVFVFYIVFKLFSTKTKPKIKGGGIFANFNKKIEL